MRDLGSPLSPVLMRAFPPRATIKVFKEKPLIVRLLTKLKK